MSANPLLLFAGATVAFYSILRSNCNEFKRVADIDARVAALQKKVRHDFISIPGTLFNWLM